MLDYIILICLLKKYTWLFRPMEVTEARQKNTQV